MDISSVHIFSRRLMFCNLATGQVKHNVKEMFMIPTEVTWNIWLSICSRILTNDQFNLLPCVPMDIHTTEAL